jgi:hypothetical protein
VLKQISFVTMALLTTACGRSSDPAVSAAEPPPAAATSASAAVPPPQTPNVSPVSARVPRRAASSPSPAARQPSESTRARHAATTAALAPAVPEYREFTLPAGTSLPLELQSTIASDASEVEDTVRAKLRNAITIDGQEVLSAGTELTGHVTEVERSGRVKGRARVAFGFTSLRHDGERVSLRSETIVREAEATKGEDATKVGIGAGAGAVLGAVIGGKDGAVKGAAIGGAAGTGAVLATRGKEVRLEGGTNLPVTLAAPLVIRVRVS